MRNYWLILGMLGLLLLLTDAKARSYGTNTYVSTNLRVKIKDLAIDLNGSFNDKAYHHGSASAWLRMDKNISISYKYRKDEYSGTVSQSYGVYYTVTLVK